MSLSLFLWGTGVAATYPIKVSSANARLLVDQSNVPFLMIADAPHSLIVNLDDAEVAFYLADRGTNGFNSLWVELLCVTYTYGRDDGSTLDGTTPFTGTLPGGYWDLTTPNETYFAHVDKIIRMAGSNGLQILLTPLETGGLTDTALANGTDRCRQYGQYLGNRYKDFSNIIWQNGNDFQTWDTPTNDAVIMAIALGIKDRDANHLQSVQLNYGVSASLDDPNWWPIISHDSVYTYYPTYDKVLTEYQRANRIPIWMIEAHYEFEDLQGELGTPAVLRRQTYWTLTSGAIGYGYGSGYTGPFVYAWDDPTNLDTVGVRELNYASALFRSREWYNLVPDTNHTILTAGYGTYETSGNVSASDYATCAREINGHTVVVYVPTPRALTIDMTRISGSSVRAWWFNPRTGIATNFANYATAGSQSFTPPDANDWVLVLDDAAQSLPAPGAAPLLYPLQITVSSLPNAQTGLLYSVQFTAIGGITPYNWSLAPASGPLPDGMGLSQSGVLSGTATSSGTFGFTARVTDAGAMTADQALTLTVNESNTPPRITGIADQTINENGSTGPLSFTVGDAESAVGSLTLTANSSDPGLVPANNIVFGGSGANRSVTVTPAVNQNGTATITITVSDGTSSASTNFVLTVSSLFTGTKAFTNATVITISDQVAATPYPSIISLSGMSGVITNVTVSLIDITHTWMADLDILLVSPGGQKVKVMSDAGSANTPSGSVTITLSDAAADYLPENSALTSGTYKPTDYAPADTFPSPAPAGPYGTNLAVFNGQSPNGIWSLYVFDDGPGDEGSMAGGWSLTVTTASATSAAPTISDITDQTTHVSTPTAAIPFTVNDADTSAANLTLSGDSSNPTLVPTNNIVFGGSGSNRTVTVTPANGQTGSATIRVTVSDGTRSASDTFVLTVRTPVISLEVPVQTAAQIAQNGFRFFVTADFPGTFIIEYTTNWANWQQIGTLQYASGQTEVIDTGAMSSPTRFYRVREP